MAKIIHKKPVPKRPRNLLHAEMVTQGILTHKVIGDKRSKILENRAKKRAMEFKKMNKEDYDD
jgi:hypothetical protein|tara:strand:- start:304 stop:492 length:189 start_codon:yes stop_codon:yes gene_type:complete